MWRTATLPVSGELLLDGGDDELLHFLVRLGDQVNRRALLHDTDVTLQRLANHLGASTSTRISERDIFSHFFILIIAFNLHWLHVMSFSLVCVCVYFCKDESETMQKL